MPETILRFDDTPGIPNVKRTQRVYFRELWNTSWTEELHLWCDEVTWSVLPTMPTASLIYHYGDILQPGETSFGRFLRQELTRLFIKIEYESEVEGEPLEWIGIIEANNDQLGGSRITYKPTSPTDFEPVATGDQYFTAYGMEWLLATHQITSAVVDGASGDLTTDTPPAFNHNGIANKKPGALAFSNNPDDAEHWSSLNIVAYLLKHQTPKDASGTRIIEFLPFAADIPNWDKPELRQQGATTYELITQLVNQRRGVGGYFLNVADTIELRTDTFTATEISIPLPEADPLKANGRQLHLIFDNDSQTSATLKTSAVELYDQVIYRGERRRSVGSFSVHGDGTIAPGWEYPLEQKYQDGGSGASGYAAAGTKEKRRIDEAARGDSTLSNVFNYFRIPKTWERKVGDGEGGSKSPMFPVTDEFGLIASEPAFVFYPEMRIEQTTPLIEGVDYSGDKIANATFVLPSTERSEAPPAAWAKVPGKQPAEWRLVSDIGLNADLEITDTKNEFYRWSASIRIPADGKGLHLDVHGAPKHVLDAKGFTYADSDEKLGEWSYRDTSAGIIFTLSIPDDRYCEGRWPETVESSKSYVKRKLLQADGFRKDYVAPNTVVGVNAAGQLQRSDGGYIPRQSDSDDQHKLTAAAKIAAIYYTSEHRILSLSTYRLQPFSKLRLAALITQIGDPAYGETLPVNSPVTEIRISSPLGTPESSEAARMDVMTWAGEIDPLLLAPIEPSDEHSRPTAAGLASGAFSSSQVAGAR